MYQITIDGVLNGFVCKVGCQELVFTSASDLCDALAKYLKDPRETEKKFLENRLPTASIRIPVPHVAPAPVGPAAPGGMTAAPDDRCRAEGPL